MAGYGLTVRQKSGFQIIEGKNDVIIFFGKYSGLEISLIAKLDPRYIRFLIDNIDMPMSVLKILQHYCKIPNRIEKLLLGQHGI